MRDKRGKNNFNQKKEQKEDFCITYTIMKTRNEKEIRYKGKYAI